MKIMKLALVFVLGLLFIGSPSYAGKGDKWEEDYSPLNIMNPQIQWEQRDYGLKGNQPWGGISGDYIMVSAQIVLGGLLEDWDKIMEVTAKEIGTDREFSLTPDVCKNWGQGFVPNSGQSWVLFLRPDPWIFNSNWEFTLRYHGSDGKKHKQQVLEVTPNNPQALPIKPTHVMMEKRTDSVYVSWSGIGNPLTDNRFEYRFLVMDGSGCPIVSYKGTYDDVTNRVKFDIPLAWIGYRVRLENRFYVDPDYPYKQNRACVFPTFP